MCTDADSHSNYQQHLESKSDGHFLMLTCRGNLLMRKELISWQCTESLEKQQNLEEHFFVTR